MTCQYLIDEHDERVIPSPSPCRALDYITFCIANHCNMINVSLNKPTTTTTTKTPIPLIDQLIFIARYIAS